MDLPGLFSFLEVFKEQGFKVPFVVIQDRGNTFVIGNKFCSGINHKAPLAVLVGYRLTDGICKKFFKTFPDIFLAVPQGRIGAEG